MINILTSVKESLWYLLIVGVLKRCRCEVMLRNFHHKQTKQENKGKKMHSNTNNAVNCVTQIILVFEYLNKRCVSLLVFMKILTI